MTAGFTSSPLAKKMCDELHSRLGQRIKDLRNLSEWKTQLALASAADVSPNSLGELERGNWKKQGVTVGQLCKIADALGVELLIEFSDDPVTGP